MPEPTGGEFDQSINDSRRAEFETAKIALANLLSNGLDTSVFPFESGSGGTVTVVEFKRLVAEPANKQRILDHIKDNTGALHLVGKILDRNKAEEIKKEARALLYRNIVDALSPKAKDPELEKKKPNPTLEKAVE